MVENMICFQIVDNWVFNIPGSDCIEIKTELS